MMLSRTVCDMARAGISWSRSRQLLSLPTVSMATRHHQFDARDPDHEEKQKEMVVTHGQLFEKLSEQKAKDKKTFQRAIQLYLKHQGVQRRGHVEFIYASLEKMKDFGVAKDLNAYKQIIDLLPKEKMICTSTWESELMHYPKQQYCLIDILDHMESNGVIPDNFVGNQIVQIFGTNTHPFRKYQRMMYWMPKFKYANPYYIPHQLPDDSQELARMALARMAVDLENVIATHNTSDYENVLDETYIVSAQSQTQRELISQHSTKVPLYVEGAYVTWLRDIPITYFVMRGDKTNRYALYKTHKETPEPVDAPISVSGMFEESSALVERPSIHEQEDGTIMAMCVTGTSSKDSLASWVKALQVSSPKLAEIPIVFLLRSPATGIQQFIEDEPNLPQATQSS